MTDKEHLEGVKNLIDKYENCYDKEIALKYASDLMRYHARYFVKQAERVQELEEDCEYLSHHYGLEAEKNKCYREALELLAKNETLGKDVNTGKIAISYNGMIALRGLGVFNDDNYIVYGVEEMVTESWEDEE